MDGTGGRGRMEMGDAGFKGAALAIMLMRLSGGLVEEVVRY